MRIIVPVQRSWTIFGSDSVDVSGTETSMVRCNSVQMIGICGVGWSRRRVGSRTVPGWIWGCGRLFCRRPFDRISHLVDWIFCIFQAGIGSLIKTQMIKSDIINHPAQGFSVTRTRPSSRQSTSLKAIDNFRLVFRETYMCLPSSQPWNQEKKMT